MLEAIANSADDTLRLYPDPTARGFREAPFGVIGMETAAAVIWTCLVEKGVLSPVEMARRMSLAPASPQRHHISLLTRPTSPHPLRRKAGEGA